MRIHLTRIMVASWLLVAFVLGPDLLPGGDTPNGSAAPVFHLPWEAGSVWRVTNGNEAGHHADQYIDYAFDAVPVSERSTNRVTAIANGTVLGFQNSVPNEALFSSGHAGNCMMIRHEDGTVSIYAHLAAGSIPSELLREGAEVRSGMVIGTVGNTGYADGVHLHWSLLSAGYMYDSEGYRTCYGPSIPSQYADNDRELIEDGGVPRAGRYYESTNVVGGSVQEPPAPTVAPVQVAPTEAPVASEVPQGAGTGQMDIGATGSDGHAIGAQFTVTTIDGTNLGTCTLEGQGDEPYPLSCQVDVPRGTMVIVTLDVSTLPPGMVPVENPLSFDTSTDPGAASHWGVFFQIEAQGDSAINGRTSEVAIVTTENGEPTYDACFVLVNFSNEGCDENRDGKITFQDVPLGTYTLRQTADLGPDRSIPDTTITVTGVMEADGWERFYATIETGASTGVGQTHQVAIFTTEHGQPAYDACYVLVGYSNEGCDENRDGRVMFADIPWGTYTVRQTANLGPGRSVHDFTIQVRGNVSSAGWEAFFAIIVNSATSSSTSGLSGAVDIALITRDPQDGHLLTGTCYVLVGYSNEGCDENGDGQVTFDAVLYGTYTVRQTKTPSGYPTINDYEIFVAGLGGVPGTEPFEVPLGFVVKQASEQNLPGTYNVSVILLDMETHEKSPAVICVEFVGASNLGCDDGLRDGQVDFLDLPAGGPYEVRFSNLPPGYEVYEEVARGEPMTVSLDDTPDMMSNRFMFVLLVKTE